MTDIDYVWEEYTRQKRALAALMMGGGERDIFKQERHGIGGDFERLTWRNAGTRSGLEDTAMERWEAEGNGGDAADAWDTIQSGGMGMGRVLWRLAQKDAWTAAERRGLSAFEKLDSADGTAGGKGGGLTVRRSVSAESGGEAVMTDGSGAAFSLAERGVGDAVFSGLSEMGISAEGRRMGSSFFDATAVRTETAEAVGTDAQMLSRAFQRDARRYDGGFALF